MLKAGLLETIEALEAIRMDGRAGRDIARKDRDNRAGLEVGDDIHASSAARSTPLLHSHQNESRPPVFELPAASQPGLLAPNPRIINLYFPAQLFPSSIHHRPTELVQHHPDSLIPRNAELALKQQGGNATFVGGHQIRRPEPVGQRSLGSVKNGSGRQRNLVSAFDALAPALAHQFIRAGVTTSRANKSIRPTACRQVLLASFLRGEVALKLA